MSGESCSIMVVMNEGEVMEWVGALKLWQEEPT